MKHMNIPDATCHFGYQTELLNLIKKELSGQ